MNQLVGAVRIEIKVVLKLHKLLILINAASVKNHQFAKPRYTRYTARLVQLGVTGRCFQSRFNIL